MQKKPRVAAATGVVIGFILGFFAARTQQEATVPEPAPQAQADSSALPSDHPPPEVLEQLARLQDHARDHPEDTEVRIRLGNSYYDMKRWDAAAAWYTEALELDPGNVSVRTDLGTAQLYQGQVESAIESYRKSLSLDPNHPQTLQNLGIAHYFSGELETAIRIWQRLLAAHPAHADKEKIEEFINNARERLNQEQS
ncbi:MAG: tetratricopeptide repeat protein [Acidobacteriota bacterium]|nr:tetratricopeptide repeat protein [Acidobacteriota bacterium]